MGGAGLAWFLAAGRRDVRWRGSGSGRRRGWSVAHRSSPAVACSGTGGHRRQGSCRWIDLAGFLDRASGCGRWGMDPQGNWLAAARWEKAPKF